MNHIGTLPIETPRLLLRPFTRNDAPAMFTNWANDDRVTKFLRWPTHRSVKDSEKFLTHLVGAYDNRDFYLWAITLKNQDAQPIGSIGVVDKNEATNMVHIGYCIGQKWWNNGITTEAFAGVIPFLFDKVKVNRIESQHDPNNPASGKIMLRCGLTHEGTLRQSDISNRGIVDAAVYGLLAQDYYNGLSINA